MAQSYWFEDDGVVPNNPVLPVVVIAGTGITQTADACDRFRVNGWGGTWEYTVFDYTHYHPSSHEALICVAGWAEIQLGGDRGRAFRLTPGDCVVLPAGTGHRRLASDPGFLVVGAY
ncbi:MAG: cupin domain-containing protein, partial [Pseudomonadota bacterium]